jgi:glycosyltransferase involved in cell wall biosynthesis
MGVRPWIDHTGRVQLVRGYEFSDIDDRIIDLRNHQRTVRQVIAMIINSLVFNSSSRRSTVASKPMLVCVSDIERDFRLDDFCSIQTSGTKILVGNGPYLQELSSRYNDVIFVPNKASESLAHYYANADVLICPNGSQGRSSIIAESICCGTPIAARSHVMTDGMIIRHVTGEILDDLPAAIELCLNMDRYVIEQLGHILFAKQNKLISHRS